MGKSSKSADVWPLTVMMCRPFLLLQLMLLLFLLPEAGAQAPTKTLPSKCRHKCGDTAIPYPFGVGDGCFREGFRITCNYTYNPPRPFIGTGNIEIINISLLTGELQVYKHIAYACYNNTARLNHSSSAINLTGNPAAYRLSSTRNKFTAVGCHTLAYILNPNGYTSGCVSICNTRMDAQAGPCNGMGCCQTTIPQDLTYYKGFFQTYNNTNVLSFNPCSYAFLAENDWFVFDASALSAEFYSRHNGRVPMVLDWAIRNETCVEAARNLSSYACVSKNSFCYNSSNGPGYLCNCSEGYEGNPYVSDGCKDINECDNPKAYTCYGACTNVPGSYNCMCPRGTKGDPTSKNGCHPIPSKFPRWMQVFTGTGVGILFLVVVGFSIYLGLEKRKLIRTKQRFFEQNGGFLLQQQMRSHRGAAFKIFTKEELEKATNNFNQDRVIGRGGQGTVYKGVLEDQRVVAIKKSKFMDEKQMNEFGKEMLILSQVNHRNVVKLLGCCLEVEVPMLVYEFISNGTVFQYIHDKTRRTPVPLDTRLRIAMESAHALAYLHSSASPPIIHGDVKPSNILLDENYTAKVSDFGASKLVPTDKAQLATLVQGTCGYLDPEYLQTCQLTEKSDVYSFGIVLLELLTGKMAFYFDASEEERSLASIFLAAMKDNRLLEIIDNQVMNEGAIELLKDLAILAAECLKVRREERPTMKEVADGLESLRKLRQHPWVLHNPEEIESLLGESVHAPPTTVYASLGQRAALSIEAGR